MKKLPSKTQRNRTKHVTGCKHANDRLVLYTRPEPGARVVFVDGQPSLAEQRVNECNVCQDCGEWLALGPANDVGVEVEIRAASRYACAVGDYLAPCHCASGQLCHEQEDEASLLYQVMWS